MTVSTRFSDIEHERIEAAAKRAGCNVSGLIRRLVLEHVAPFRPGSPMPQGTSTSSAHVSVIWADDFDGGTP